MKPVILLVGCPDSGKTWVAQQLGEKFLYVPHDKYPESAYGQVLFQNASNSKAVLGEIPFGLSKFQSFLESKHVPVHPVVVFEQEPILRKRWVDRSVKPETMAGHLARQNTHRERAMQFGHFVGNSQAVLKYLLENEF